MIETWCSDRVLTLHDFGVLLPEVSALSVFWRFYDLVKHRAWLLEMARGEAASDVNFTSGALQPTFFNVTGIISWSLCAEQEDESWHGHFGQVQCVSFPYVDGWHDLCEADVGITSSCCGVKQWTPATWTKWVTVRSHRRLYSCSIRMLMRNSREFCNG